MLEKVEEAEEITVIKIVRRGESVEANLEQVEGYDPVDPQAMIGACANIITEMNQYVFSHPVSKGEA